MKPEMWMVLLMSLTVVMSTASAQSSCTNVLLSMLPCLNYITQNASSPSQQCCNQFAHVVQFSSECLCLVLDGGGSHLGISFNETQALALPKACSVQTPPVSRCNVAIGSSVNTHVGSSNNSELHGNGSKTVPRDGSSSDGISFVKSSLLFSPLLPQYYLTSWSTTDFCLPIKFLIGFFVFFPGLY